MDTMTEMEPAVRGAAFQLLLTRGKPIPSEDLAAAAAIAPDHLSQLLDPRSRRPHPPRRGATRDRLLRAQRGARPSRDRHRWRRFWTWCAYDIVGIFGALGETGSARSKSPSSGATIELRFSDGRPEPAEAVLFRPDASLAACCDNVYEEWCPNSNLFADEAAARSWAEAHQLKGQILSLAEASDLAAAEWRPLVPASTSDQ